MTKPHRTHMSMLTIAYLIFSVDAVKPSCTLVVLLQVPRRPSAVLSPTASCRVAVLKGVVPPKTNF